MKTDCCEEFKNYFTGLDERLSFVIEIKFRLEWLAIFRGYFLDGL